VFFLPNRSDSSAVNDTPAIHPTKAGLTNHPYITSSRTNFDFTKPIVPEVLSYQKRNPLKAAVKGINNK